MTLKPYEEFAQPLAFPIGGKVYTVPPLPYQAGLQLQRILAGDVDEDLPAQDLWRLVMGPAWDQMAADDAPVEAMTRAGVAALADFRWGRDAAVKAWETGLDPEALAAAVTAATQTNPVSTASPRTAAAPRTPSPGSTSGTSSPRATAQPKRKARPSRS